MVGDDVCGQVVGNTNCEAHTLSLLDALRGEVHFAIGDCRMTTAGNTLLIACEAPDDDKLVQVGDVVSSHLVRFAAGEVDEVQWQPSAP